LRLTLKLFRGEPAISGFDWHFTTTHSSSHDFSTSTRFGPPREFNPASPWPWVDHPVSGLLRQTIALLRLAFASAPVLPHLNLAWHSNSPVRSAKSTRSLPLPLLVDTRFQVLFHSPPGVLFTFPSRYYSTIGRKVVFSLGRWSSLLPTGFLVSRGTRDVPRLITRTSPTGLSPSSVQLPSCVRLAR